MIVSPEQIGALVSEVQKPARYLGGEWNSIVKNWAGLDATIALAYPDVYEIGMSNLGLGILYDLVNQRQAYAAERVYAPWPDMAAAMRQAGVPLFSLETRHALRDFDVLGFSLQYELTLSNVLAMLDLAGLPVRADERDASMPLVLAGGSCAYNPEPMADFVDAFVIGEGEEVIIEVLDAVSAWKQRPAAEHVRLALLEALAQIPGVYVPSLYRPIYDAEGHLAGMERLSQAAPPTVRRRIVPVLPPPPARPIVPTLQAVHDRAMIEIQRGCSRGCRFCQAGMVYRPIRERSAEEILQAVDQQLAATGYDEVGMVSLSSSDHSAIGQLVEQTMARHNEDRVSVSLPSLRIDSFSVQLARSIQQTRKTGFTFAPEAGSQRMRDVINKGVVEQDILATARDVFGAGWNRIKLYFMLGLPFERDEDMVAIGDLIWRVLNVGRDMRSRKVEINVSLSTFVPKPHTPFQWAPLLDQETIAHRQRMMLDACKARDVRVSWSRWNETWLEALISRGDRRVGAVIERAWRSGAAFDAWGEQFRPELWHQAVEDVGLDDDWYTTRARSRDEVLPWDHIDVGVSRNYLWAENERAESGALSPDCREQCHGCGIATAYLAEMEAAPQGAWGCP